MAPGRIRKEMNDIKAFRKFTIEDAQSEWILIVESLVEVTNMLKLEEYQTKVAQPRIVIIGSVRAIEKVLVAFGGQFYTVSDVLSAVCLSFQIMFVFNLEYPPASKGVWEFIEIVGYEMNAERSASSNKLKFVRKFLAICGRIDTPSS